MAVDDAVEVAEVFRWKWQSNSTWLCQWTKPWSWIDVVPVELAELLAAVVAVYEAVEMAVVPPVGVAAQLSDVVPLGESIHLFDVIPV